MANRHSTLKPGGLVFDVQSLGRRPGSMIEVDREAPAPADLGKGIVAVPVDSPIELQMRFESVVEGVLASGTAYAEVSGECARCLDPISWETEVDIQELFLYQPTDARGRPIVVDSPDDGSAEEDPLPTLDGDLLDLEPVLRDAIVLALPLAPVCDPDCLGLCIECGVRLADDPGHRHDLVDPRWSALQSFPAADGPITDGPA